MEPLYRLYVGAALNPRTIGCLFYHLTQRWLLIFSVSHLKRNVSSHRGAERAKKEQPSKWPWVISLTGHVCMESSGSLAHRLKMVLWNPFVFSSRKNLSFFFHLINKIFFLISSQNQILQKRNHLILRFCLVFDSSLPSVDKPVNPVIQLHQDTEN